jgi:hypothetical protein
LFFIKRNYRVFFIPLGVNSHSTFGAQGDPNNDKLTILPVLQDTHSINQAQHTHYDEQLSTRLID